MNPRRAPSSTSLTASAKLYAVVTEGSATSSGQAGAVLQMYLVAPASISASSRTPLPFASMPISIAMPPKAQCSTRELYGRPDPR